MKLWPLPIRYQSKRFLKSKRQTGFTLVELIVVMGVFAILVMIATIDLVAAQRRSDLNSTMNTFFADARAQQIKAMTGDTGGRSSASSYGIYFTTNSYTLFAGSSYVPNSTSNFIITLPTTVEFQTINLPSSAIIFSGDGTVTGYSSSQDSITLKSTQGPEQKTLIFNALGVVSQVN